MVMDTRQQFNILASIAVVERVINNEDLGCVCRCQWQNRLVEDNCTEQMQELAPVGIDRIEKAVNGVLANLTSGVIRLEVAEEILAGEYQAEDHPHHHNGSDPALFGHVALLQ